ncbi:hypothetical protein [Virgibacillus salexigens]|uniref:Uncharacterized protein n=1 Tax=Virgibacillus massiliensis TaxID=1462526 RepID=A0A024QGS4_9BACI|nr:hypothetical protein [Virgibacillus massiliensis]CDQ41758.1 hypothetical protein BN990_04135 [Virgibacillus massiliensis]
MGTVVGIVGVGFNEKQIMLKVDKDTKIQEENNYVAIKNVIFPHQLYRELHLVDETSLENIEKLL